MAIKEFILSWGMLVMSVVFNAVGVFIIKLKLNELGPVKVDSIKGVSTYFLSLFRSGIVIAGAFLFAVAPLLFAVALSRMEISVAYPVQVVLNFVLLLLLAVLFLGENLTVVKVAAIFLAFVSMFLLYKK